MKPVIDHDLCIGDGVCEEICPEVFELRDDGLAYITNNDPDASLKSKIEEAIKECPTSAIYLEEE